MAREPVERLVVEAVFVETLADFERVATVRAEDFEATRDLVGLLALASEVVLTPRPRPAAFGSSSRWCREVNRCKRSAATTRMPAIIAAAALFTAETTRGE